MTGILNIAKPPGMTSFDVVAFVRRLLKIKKIGHCGTLDPDAAGVLPICIGGATGVTDMLAESGKAYRVEAVPGLLTDTLDISGAVLDRRANAMPDRNIFECALGSFVGAGIQIPPMYSAIKIGGRKLYELARKGVEVERPARAVGIYALKTALYKHDRVIIDVECSKGTYIRSLCRDIGEKLGIYLCVSFLLRTKSAGFRIEDALSVEDVERNAATGTLECVMTPVDALFSRFPKAVLADARYARFMNGASVSVGRSSLSGESGAAWDFMSRAAERASGSEEHASGSEDCAKAEERAKAEEQEHAAQEFARVYSDGGRFLGLAYVAPESADTVSLRVKKFLY